MLRNAAPLSQFPEPYASLAAILNDGTQEWRGELFDVPDLTADVMQWRARPGGPNLGAILLHMILVEFFWFQRVPLGRTLSPAQSELLMRDHIDVDEGKWPVPPAQPLSWYLALADQMRVETLSAINEWPGPDVPLEIAPENVVTMPWVMGHMIQHEAYHGGQIVLLVEHWKSTQAAPAPVS